MFDTYIKDPKIEYDSWLVRCMKDDRSLWDLAMRLDIPEELRIVHAATFDHAIIEQKNLARYVECLRKFLKAAAPTAGEYVCHLGRWADFIEEHPNVEAIGFYINSIVENPWVESYNEETGEETPYNLKTGDKHFEVFERYSDENLPAWIKELKEEND